MSITFSPLMPSNISRRSMNTASFFTSAPTPSASSACQALGAIWMPAPISPNCGACSSTTERKPLRARASAAARPPIPPPAMITGSLFLEEDGEAFDFTFGVYKIDALASDAKRVAVSLEEVLDEAGPHTLLFLSKLHHRQRRAHHEIADHDVADLVHGARQRRARVRAGMAHLPDAQLEQRAVVVDQRRGLLRILLALLERHPVGRVPGEEREPVLVALRIEEVRLVIQELLRRHESCSRATRSSARGCRPRWSPSRRGHPHPGRSRGRRRPTRFRRNRGRAARARTPRGRRSAPRSRCRSPRWRRRRCP